MIVDAHTHTPTALREALPGRFDDLHALWIGSILAHIDFLDEQIDRLSDAIEDQIAPFASAVGAVVHDPGRSTAPSRGDHLRDRDRHERVCDRQASRLVSRAVPGQRPVRRPMPLREVAQGIEVVGLDAGRVRAGRRPHQGRRSRRPVHSAETPPRTQESARRGQALDHLRLLAAIHRRALQRSRRRLLPTPRPCTRNQPARQPPRGARTRRHTPTTVNGRGGGRSRSVSCFPVSNTTETIAGLRRVNDIVDGTSLPPIPNVIDAIIHADAADALGLSLPKTR